MLCVRFEHIVIKPLQLNRIDRVIKRNRLSTRLVTQSSEDVVTGDSDKPRRQRAVTLIAINASKRSDEHVLRHFVHLFQGSEMPCHETANQSLVQTHQFSKCISRAIANSLNQLFVCVLNRQDLLHVALVARRRVASHEKWRF